VPPEVTGGPPLDWTTGEGAAVGDCKVPELGELGELDELVEFDEPAEFEEPAEFDEPAEDE
jgi:hypothetical protein